MNLQATNRARKQPGGFQSAQLAFAVHQATVEPISNEVRRILLVEDDPLILRLYSEALERQGLEVRTAADGLAGLTELSRFDPDLVVLDLLMPRLSGHEVLKYMRQQPKTKDIPVIVFSNSYLTALTEDAVALGIDRAVLKTSCSAPALAQMIEDVLQERATAGAPTKLPSISDPEPVPQAAPQASSPSLAPNAPPSPPKPAEQPAPSKAEFDFRALARQKFLASAENRLSAIWKSYKDFVDADEEPKRYEMLKVLYRNVHSLTTASGLANSHSIAQLSMVFEALLHQLVEKPAHLTPSVLRTIAAAIDVLTAMFGRAADVSAAPVPPSKALVVDDDPISTRVITASLQQAKLDARGSEDPAEALALLQAEQFNLVLLDVEMPGMNGMEVCKRLRKLPGYERVPVVYVTAHSDFETRARTILSGGTDLIAKPIFPLEMATKAVIHLLDPAR